MHETKKKLLKNLHVEPALNIGSQILIALRSPVDLC